MFSRLRSKPCRENWKLVWIVKLNAIFVQCSIFSGRAKIWSQNVWGLISYRLKISGSVFFFWHSVAHYETNIWETLKYFSLMMSLWGLFVRHLSFCRKTTACSETWLSIRKSTIRHYTLISYVLSYILVCYLAVGLSHPENRQVKFYMKQGCTKLNPAEKTSPY